MKISLIKSEYSDNKIFMKFLLNRFKMNLMHNVGSCHLEKFEEYIRNKYNIDLSYLSVLRIALSYLDIQKVRDEYKFVLSPILTYKNTNLKLEFLIKLMEYGSLELKSYPLFRTTIKEINDNMENYIKEFKIYFGIGVHTI